MSYDNLSSVSRNVLKFYQQLTGEERRIPFICNIISFLIKYFYGRTSDQRVIQELSRSCQFDI
jgi:hypothetical protein